MCTNTYIYIWMYRSGRTAYAELPSSGQGTALASQALTGSGTHGTPTLLTVDQLHGVLG